MKHYKAVDRYIISEFYQYLPIKSDFFNEDVPKFRVLDPETGEYRDVIFAKKCKSTEDSSCSTKILDKYIVHYDPV